MSVSLPAQAVTFHTGEREQAPVEWHKNVRVNVGPKQGPHDPQTLKSTERSSGVVAQQTLLRRHTLVQLPDWGVDVSPSHSLQSASSS